jgi:prevent-host-death family protein
MSMINKKYVTEQEFVDNLDQILDEVAAGQVYLITREGAPSAAVIPISMYEDLLRLAGYNTDENVGDGSIK